MRGTECLPAPLTVGSFVAQMERERRAGRDPSREAGLFMPTACGPCRFGQYRTLGRLVLDRLGCPDVPIVSPGSSDTYFTLRPIGLVWESVLAGDILFKMRCRVRPYEKTDGDTDEVLERHTTAIESAVAGGRIDWDTALTAAMDDFLHVPVSAAKKPLVGIVGEIYIRSNPYANGRLVETIERFGGEAWLAPTAEWFEYTAWLEHFLARRMGLAPGDILKRLLKRSWVRRRARRMYRPTMRLLHDRVEPDTERLVAAGSALLPIEFQGESILTVGRAKLFEGDGCALVVNCAPFGCMHGCIATALFEQLRGTFRIPVVSVFYGDRDDNAQLLTFLRQASRGIAAGVGDRSVPA
jgi:predicted nucleotide-binding protein (sugar kinase/HSP70/actin superfamily)